MLIVVSTTNKLRIRSIRLGKVGALATFNRLRQTAEIILLATVLPFRRYVMPFTDIREAVVRKGEKFNGTITYGLTLRRRWGEDLNFACTSKEAAMDVMHSLNDFLSRK